MDRWRPETHVPLPRRRDDSQSGERRDVGRTAMCWPGSGADRHPATWHDDFLARFANVPRNDRAPALYVPFAEHRLHGGAAWVAYL
jgi:hypothetical protein